MFCSTSDLYFQALRWLSLGKTQYFAQAFQKLGLSLFLCSDLAQANTCTYHTWGDHIAFEGKREDQHLEGLEMPLSNSLFLADQTLTPAQLPGSQGLCAHATHPSLYKAVPFAVSAWMYSVTSSNSGQWQRNRHSPLKTRYGTGSGTILTFIQWDFIYIFVSVCVCVCVCLCI